MSNRAQTVGSVLTAVLVVYLIVQMRSPERDSWPVQQPPPAEPIKLATPAPLPLPPPPKESAVFAQRVFNENGMAQTLYDDWVYDHDPDERHRRGLPPEDNAPAMPIYKANDIEDGIVFSIACASDNLYKCSHDSPFALAHKITLGDSDQCKAVVLKQCKIADVVHPEGVDHNSQQKDVQPDVNDPKWHTPNPSGEGDGRNYDLACSAETLKKCIIDPVFAAQAGVTQGNKEECVGLAQRMCEVSSTGAYKNN